MSSNTALRSIVTLTFLILTVACGAENGNHLAEGGIEGTGITDDAPHVSIGSISGFGSIFVNGVEFETTSSTVIINGDVMSHVDGSDDPLKLAMVVTVEGEINDDGSTGTADLIVFDRDVQGPIATITTIDFSHKQLLILGLEVLVSSDTVFEGVSFETLTENEVVEVSGFVNADNQLVATWLQKQADSFEEGEEIEVEAHITTLDLAQQILTLSALTVDYSQANLVRFSNETPSVGDFIEVRGSSFNESGHLVAEKVKYKGEKLNIEEGSKLELEGVISSFTSVSEFSLHGVTVNAENATIKKGNINDLAIGLRVEVEGLIDDNEVLLASEVTIKKESQLRLTAPVSAIDSETGVITLITVDITIDNQTAFQDVGSNHLKYFNTNDIAVGDWLTIRATGIGEDIVASKVIRIQDRKQVTIKGPIDSLSLNSAVVLGVSLDMSAVSMEEQMQFAVGDSLSVTGESSEDVVFVAEVERDE